MIPSLHLDPDGTLWLREDDGEDARATPLGPVDDPATSYRVPGGLLDELGRLEAEWAEGVAYRLACRDEVLDTYRRNSL